MRLAIRPAATFLRSWRTGSQLGFGVHHNSQGIAHGFRAVRRTSLLPTKAQKNVGKPDKAIELFGSAPKATSIKQRDDGVEGNRKNLRLARPRGSMYSLD